MKNKPAVHSATLVAMAVSLLLIATPVSAAEDVLTLLPENTLGFAVVNRLSDVSEKLGKHAQELGFPAPDLLALAKERAGMGQGLDDDGIVLLAIARSVDGSEKIEDSEALIALPVSDYKQFIGQFNGDDSSEITEANVAGLPMLMAEKSGYAVLVPSDSEHRLLLEEVLEREAQVISELSDLKEWIDENDAAVVVLPPGIKLLAEKGIVELEKVKKQFSEMTELGQQAEQVAAGLDMYLRLLHVIKDEVRTAADGLRIDDAGNIRFGGRIRFVDGGSAAKISDASKRADEDLLAGLPGGPFVGAVGASLSPECGELVAKWSVEMMTNNPALYGVKLSNEAAEKYLELTRASMNGIRGFSMMMSSGEEGESILDGMLGIISVDDATDYLTQYEETIDAFQTLIEESGSAFPYKMEVTKAEVSAVEGLKISMDMGAALNAQDAPPEATRMLKQMFGEHGKLTAYILGVEKNRLLFSYGSENSIKRQIAAIKSGEAGLAREPSIARTASMLPKDASLAAYLSPRGAVAWFKNVVPLDALREIPEFPETPAIGFSAKAVRGGLETELVVPSELPRAVKEYVQSVRSQ